MVFYFGFSIILGIAIAVVACPSHLFSHHPKQTSKILSAG